MLACCPAAVQAATGSTATVARAGWQAQWLGNIISMLLFIMHKCLYIYIYIYIYIYKVILSVFLRTAFNAFTLVEPRSASAFQASVCFLLPCACTNPVSTALATPCVCSPCATAANSINFDVRTFDQLLGALVVYSDLNTAETLCCSQLEVSLLKIFSW